MAYGSDEGGIHKGVGLFVPVVFYRCVCWYFLIVCMFVRVLACLLVLPFLELSFLVCASVCLA